MSDLAYIIDQMLFHLAHVDEHLSQNKNLYNFLDVANKKAGLTLFIKQVSDFNKLLLSIVDDGINCALSSAVTLADTIVILSVSIHTYTVSSWSWLMLGGMAATVYFAHDVVEQLNKVEPTAQLVADKFRSLPQDCSIFGGDSNHHAFSPQPLLH